MIIISPVLRAFRSPSPLDRRVAPVEVDHQRVTPTPSGVRRVHADVLRERPVLRVELGRALAGIAFF